MREYGSLEMLAVYHNQSGAVKEMAAALKYSLKSRGTLWRMVTLRDNPATEMTSSAALRGGQASVQPATMPQLPPDGMPIVGQPNAQPVLIAPRNRSASATHSTGAGADLPLSDAEKRLRLAVGTRLTDAVARLWQ